MLGQFCGAIFVRLVKGAAPLLSSKTFAVEQNLRLSSARASGNHFVQQLGNFVKPWAQPTSWSLRTKVVSMDFGTRSEHEH
eukprot:8736115-Pyramimonas_sp.AAC.1